MSYQYEMSFGDESGATLLHRRAELLECLTQLVDRRRGPALRAAPSMSTSAPISALERVRRQLAMGRTGPLFGTGTERLDAESLRELYREIYATLVEQVRGQEDAVRAMALAALVHVATDAPGQRILLMGPSGVGKSTLCRSVANLFELPHIHVDALDLTGPGWGSAPSIGDVIEVSLRGVPPDSLWARRAVIVIDEIHHARLYPGLTGNSFSKRAEVVNSLLGLTGGGVGIQLGDSGATYRADAALVVLAGAFTDLASAASTPTIEELVAFGFPYELVTRMQEIIALRPLSARAVVEILERWPTVREVQSLAERLGTNIRIAPETFQLIGRVVADRGTAATVRTGAGWLLSAVKARLGSVLGGEHDSSSIVSPDCLNISQLGVAERRGDDGPDDQGTPSWTGIR